MTALVFDEEKTKVAFPIEILPKQETILITANTKGRSGTEAKKELPKTVEKQSTLAILLGSTAISISFARVIKRRIL